MSKALSFTLFTAAISFSFPLPLLAADNDPPPHVHAITYGNPGDPAKVTRTVDVVMSDKMRFQPANITVQRGETVRFRVKNTGEVKHEMVLGTKHELQEHAKLMQKFPEMEHDDPNAVTVEPGKTGEMLWQFTKTGTVDFACLQPGHFESGMVGKITVRAAQTSDKK
jgi:uncharacterized cupredoxin-like copper-binding protein